MSDENELTLFPGEDDPQRRQSRRSLKKPIRVSPPERSATLTVGGLISRLDLLDFFEQTPVRRSQWKDHVDVLVVRFIGEIVLRFFRSIENQC